MTDIKTVYNLNNWTDSLMIASLTSSLVCCCLCCLDVSGLVETEDVPDWEGRVLGRRRWRCWMRAGISDVIFWKQLCKIQGLGVLSHHLNQPCSVHIACVLLISFVFSFVVNASRCQWISEWTTQQLPPGFISTGSRALLSDFYKESSGGHHISCEPERKKATAERDKHRK